MKAERHRCDVLVIGAGLAGLQAAEVVAQFVRGVIVVDKETAGRAPASRADTVAFAAYLGQGAGGLSSPLFNRAHITFDRLGEEQFARMRQGFFAYRDEIIRNAAGLADPLLAEFVVDGIYNRISWLESYGLHVARDDSGKYRPLPTPAHTEPRVFLFEESGEQVLQAILRSAQLLGVEIRNKTYIVKVLTRDQRVVGALGIDLERGTPVVFDAKAIILATGGADRLYRSIPNGTCGDGYALARDLGLPLANMEFVYFVPEVATDDEIPQPVGLILLGLGCELRNGRGERFLEDYDPKRKELSSIAILSQAIARQEAGPVRSALAAETARLCENVPLLRRCLGKLDREVRWRVGCGGLLGGIRHHVFQTSVKGLFLAGELATGVHGADALPSVGTSSTLYTSENAGSLAAAYAGAAQRLGLDEAELARHQEWLSTFLEMPDRLSDEELGELEEDVRKTMWNGAGVLRNGVDLVAAKEELSRIERKLQETGARDTTSLRRLLELTSLVWTGKTICEAALARQQSLGQHCRVDS